MPDNNDENAEPSSVKLIPKKIGGVTVIPNDNVSIYLSFLLKQLNYVDRSQTCFASGNNAALGTGQLASSYALIVISKNKEGVALFGLNHWIGDRLTAEGIIIQMKNELLKRGAEEDQFKCLAIGGHIDFPQMKNEIQTLVPKGLIHGAIFDLNSSTENTALIVSSAPGNKIFIEYETKKPTYAEKESLLHEDLARLEASNTQQGSAPSTATPTEDSLEETIKKFKA